MISNRYKLLNSKDEYELMNLVKNAFLAGENGSDVDEILKGLLTTDEKIKIGRRIQVAYLLMSGMSGEDIKTALGVGRDTITIVSKQLFNHPLCFKLISERQNKVEKEYEEKRFRKVGGSKLVHKNKEYTRFKRKDVKR